MKKNRAVSVCVIILALAVNARHARAESILLKSGRKVEGKIVEKNNAYIKVMLGEGIIVPYLLNEIAGIDGVALSPPVSENDKKEGKEEKPGRENLSAGEIVSRMLDVYGGAAKWEQIEGWTCVSRAEFPETGEVWETTSYVKLPEQFRFDLKVSGGKGAGDFSLVSYKGAVKYFSGGRQAKDIPEGYKRQLYKTLQKVRRTRAPAQSRYFYEIRGQMELAGKQNVNGRECYVLNYEDDEGPRGRLFVDATDFRSLKLELDDDSGRQGQECFLGEKLMEDRGIMFPSSKSVYRGKTLILRSETVSVSFIPPGEEFFEADKKDR